MEFNQKVKMNGAVVFDTEVKSEEPPCTNIKHAWYHFPRLQCGSPFPACRGHSGAHTTPSPLKFWFSPGPAFSPPLFLPPVFVLCWPIYSNHLNSSPFCCHLLETKGFIQVRLAA